MNILLNNYYKIYFNNELIASGKCLALKNKDGKTTEKPWPSDCISFDDKYFFNTASKLIKIQKVEYCQNFIKDINYLNSILKIIHWSKCGQYYDYDIYIENTINELDPQIEPLVNILNKFENMYTVGSCSGHNKQSAYVDIKFQTLQALKKLLIILEHKNIKYKFILFNSTNNINSVSDGVILKLKTKNISQKAYKDIQILTNYLKAYVNI